LKAILFTSNGVRALGACGWVLGVVLASTGNPLHARPRPTLEISSAADHLARGRSLLTAGKNREALAEFLEACRLEPSSAQGFILAGIARYQLGEYRDAVLALRRAVQLDPASEAAHYNLAMSLARLKENDEGIRELRSVLALDPQSTAAHYNLGVLLEEKGRYEDAIHNFLDVEKIQPGDGATLLHLVTAYYGVGDSQQAIRLAHEGANNDPKGELAGRLAEIMIRHGDFESAVQLLEPIRSRAPKSSGVDVTLARAYLGAGEPRKAIDLLKPAQSGEASWQIPYLLGLAYVAENQRQSAIAAFRDATHLGPDQPDPHYRLGGLLLNAPDEADQQTGVTQVSRAIALEPRTPEHYEVLGRWFLQHDQLKAAIEILDQGIKDGGPTAELEAMMALALAALHGGSSAKPFAERALQLDSGLALAHYLVGFCLLSAGDYAQAAKYYEQAAELDLHNDVYSYNTAVALQRLNRLSEALPFAQKSVELNPGRSLNHYFLGKLYSKLNRDTDAVAELEASVRLNPELDNSYYLLAQIYERSGNATRAQEMRDKLEQLKQSRQRMVGIDSPESEPSEMISPSRVLQDHR